MPGCYAHAIALNLHCEPGLVMDSYPGPFGQVLTHLVVNAMTHAFPDRRGGAIDVKISAAGPDHVDLRVADNGCGMAPEIKRLAFDPFFTTRRHYGATGLGLHTVYNIVAKQMGEGLRPQSPENGNNFESGRRLWAIWPAKKANLGASRPEAKCKSPLLSTFSGTSRYIGTKAGLLG